VIKVRAVSKRLITVRWRHGEYGFTPNGNHFTKLTRDGAWCGLAFLVGKRWHGLMRCELP
jgi:hypothetical protein